MEEAYQKANRADLLAPQELGERAGVAAAACGVPMWDSGVPESGTRAPGGRGAGMASRKCLDADPEEALVRCNAKGTVLPLGQPMV